MANSSLYFASRSRDDEVGKLIVLQPLGILLFEFVNELDTSLMQSNGEWFEEWVKIKLLNPDKPTTHVLSFESTSLITSDSECSHTLTLNNDTSLVEDYILLLSKITVEISIPSGRERCNLAVHPSSCRRPSTQGFKLLRLFPGDTFSIGPLNYKVYKDADGKLQIGII